MSQRPPLAVWRPRAKHARRIWNAQVVGVAVAVEARAGAGGGGTAVDGVLDLCTRRWKGCQQSRRRRFGGGYWIGAA